MEISGQLHCSAPLPSEERVPGNWRRVSHTGCLHVWENISPLLYVHVTVHRNKFLFNITNKNARISQNFILSKNYICFGHLLCPSSGVFYCTFDSGIFLAVLMTAFKQWQDGTPSILPLLESCHQTCKKCTNVECTVENSWWWAKKMAETCRVFLKNKILEIRGACCFVASRTTNPPPSSP